MLQKRKSNNSVRQPSADFFILSPFFSCVTLGLVITPFVYTAALYWGAVRPEYSNHSLIRGQMKQGGYVVLFSLSTFSMLLSPFFLNATTRNSIAIFLPASHPLTSRWPLRGSQHFLRNKHL